MPNLYIIAGCNGAGKTTIYLDSPKTAIQRASDRVMKGGHSIPVDIIERRYSRGIYNLVKLYMPICDRWMIVNNGTITPQPVAEGGAKNENIIIYDCIWNVINEQARSR